MVQRNGMLGMLGPLGLTGCFVLVVAAVSAVDECDFQRVPLPEAITCKQLPDRLARQPQPGANSSQVGTVARKMCRKHQEDLCALPLKRTSALCPTSGYDADILEFPHMALLGFGDSNSKSDEVTYSCGGSLISPVFILTAAHCSTWNEKPMRWAVLGATNRTRSANTAQDTRQEIPVQEVVVHPDYRPPVKYNDVALARLARPALLSALNVRPACLHTDVDADPLGVEAWATGWGATGFAEDASERLIKVPLTVQPLQACSEAFRVSDLLAPGGLRPTQLCAGGGSHGRDTCQGDSGGPLQVRADPQNSYPCLHRVIGVVSFGPPCGLGKPGVYTRVAAFVPWIESVVWPSSRDSCARWAPYDDGKPSNETVRVPNSSPGSLARGMCRAFYVDFCPGFDTHNRLMRPGLTVANRCHHQRSTEERVPLTHTASSEATIMYGDGFYNNEFACAGILISPKFVLTAAHCAKLGCLSPSLVALESPNRCDKKHLYPIDSVTLHPDYDSKKRYQDVALIKLKEKVDLRDFMPACLHTDQRDALEGRHLHAQGWAGGGDWERTDHRLYARQLQVRTKRQCREEMQASTPQLPTGPSASQLCAGAGRKQRCYNHTYPGNAGAALTTTHYAISPSDDLAPLPVRQVMALESYSPPCGAGLPDVFTKVAAFIPWIESVVWPNEK